jgi:hypothetical protein
MTLPISARYNKLNKSQFDQPQSFAIPMLPMVGIPGHAFGLEYHKHDGTGYNQGPAGP